MTEQFFSQFGGLELQLKELRGELHLGEKNLSELKNEVEARNFVFEILRGLKSTSNERDPGKYGAAYYFVSKITDNDIERLNEPSLHENCPGKCKDKHTVVMSYEQTYDSPMGDTWTKQAYVLCPVNTVAYRIKTVSSDGRF